ncbi:MAG: DinB family protein [Gemmatimonadales bacterium]
MTVTARPGSDEYAPSFAGYVARTADEEDVVAVLAAQLTQLVTRLEGIPEVRGDYRYAPGKWSIKEVVGHLSDTERVFAYRALRIARGDATPLPSFDDQAYVPEMQAGERTMAALAGEWGDVRRATLALFRNLPAPVWRRRGVVGDHPISVRALAYIIAGHVRHHVEVLDARYGE